MYSPEKLNLTIPAKLGSSNNFLKINNIVDYQNLLKNFTRSQVNIFISDFNNFVEKLEDILIEEIKQITVLVDVERNETNKSYSLKGRENKSDILIFPKNSNESMRVVPGYPKPFYVHVQTTVTPYTKTMIETR